MALKVEYLAVEVFTAKPSIEALSVVIFPVRSEFDESGLFAGRYPGAVLFGGRFGAIVGPYDFARASQDEQFGWSNVILGAIEVALDADYERLFVNLAGDVECIV